MATMVVIRVSYQAIESEQIDLITEEVKKKRMSLKDYLDSEIPGVPGVQFKDAIFVPFGSEAGRQRILQRIVNKASVAAMEDEGPKELILVD